MSRGTEEGFWRPGDWNVTGDRTCNLSSAVLGGDRDRNSQDPKLSRPLVSLEANWSAGMRTLFL